MLHLGNPGITLRTAKVFERKGKEREEKKTSLLEPP